MTDNPTEQPWLLLHIDGPTGGVDARDLAQLLQDMVGVARLIADEKLAMGRRRGPMSAPERALAGLRVTSVSPGSFNIAFTTPPAAVEQQSSMLLDPEVTPAAVARQLIEEFESVSRKQPPAPQSHGRRQAVERVVRSVARIGDSAELVHHPPDGEEIRVHIVMASDAITYEEPVPDIRQRVMFGQVFMADVEDGRQRVRVKLADDSNLTMSLERDLVREMPDVLGQLAELHVSETLLAKPWWSVWWARFACSLRRSGESKSRRSPSTSLLASRGSSCVRRQTTSRFSLSSGRARRRPKRFVRIFEASVLRSSGSRILPLLRGR